MWNWCCGCFKSNHSNTDFVDHDTKVESKPHKRIKNHITDLPVTVSDLVPFHTVKQSSHYTVRYPDHPPRTVSALYRKTHAILCNDVGARCFLCSKPQSKSDPLESHHFYCEKAAEKGIDWITFGEKTRHLFHIQTGVCIGDQFDWNEVAKKPELFVDSVHNMVVLCREHHTSGSFGIHHIPFPVWILQMAPKKGFAFIINREP